MLQRLEHHDRLELTITVDQPLLAHNLAAEILLAATYYRYPLIVIDFDPVTVNRDAFDDPWKATEEGLQRHAKLIEALQAAHHHETKIVGRVFSPLDPHLSRLAVLVSSELEVSLNARLALPSEEDGTPLSRAAILRSSNELATAEHEHFTALSLLEYGIAARLGTAEWEAVRRLNVPLAEE